MLRKIPLGLDNPISAEEAAKAFFAILEREEKREKAEKEKQQNKQK
ncbi:hypothetical protein [Staphylococcus delphini]|nr:hypothetical protein [Staphylococcus delphini]UXS37983.1 hypothetical protein MUA34_06180 [Staphylococcus delphini]UXS45461.1 hypothetical protein MUA39_06295 [Staphylococcus delphini]UXV46083.1 hypothetical protein MUA63_06270 [Staphylococcus delphini]